MNQRQLRNFWTCISAIFVLTLAFQNCSQVKMTDTTAPASKASGNGGPYGGMVGKVYRHFSSAEPCSALDQRGQPLPNTEILFKPGSDGYVSPYLAREACQDFRVPEKLSEDQVQLVAGNPQAITYQNTTFTSLNPPGEFDVIAASCPAGKIQIANSSRTNLLAHSLDLRVLQTPTSAGWYIFPGIGVNLFSTIQSVPAFRIERNDSNQLEFWRRVTQEAQLQSSTEYAFTFAAQPGTVNTVDWMIYRGMTGTPGPADESALLRFNFVTSTITTQYAQNVANLRATLTPFGAGFLCTVYFTSSPTAGDWKTSIGFGPSAEGNSFGNFGDAIVGTGAQLVKTSDYCR